MFHTIIHFVFGLHAIWTVTLITCTGLVAGSCDSPWFENNGSCYYVSPNENSGEVVLSWHDAEDWCRQNGAHLTTVDNREELDAIVNTTESGVYTGAIWIGLNRLKDQTTYEWADGSNSEFRDWSPGQPQDNAVGMCVHQITHESKSCYTMVEDENIMKTIMERPEDAQPPATFHFWSTFVWEDPEELARCQQSCLDEPNCYYYTYVSYQTLTDLVWDGSCTGASPEHPYNFVVDGYAYSGIVHSCEDVGTWYEGNCGEKRGFICERGTDDPTAPLPTPAPTPSVPGFCPDGFFEAGGNKCFRLIVATSEEGYTWDEAHQLCLTEKGKAPGLASIQSEYENSVIAMQIRTHQWAFWIGLRLSTTFPDQWLWADNQEPGYFNWAEGKPTGAGKCGELWTHPGPTGTWNNQECTSRRGYVCQTYKDVDDVISTPASTVAHSCPADYYNYGGICYRKVTVASDWSAALVTCEADGATLATVHSGAENSALYVFASDIAPFWIGYYKNENEQWVWTDDWPDIYSNWNASEGPGSGGGCASFKDTGKWKDDTCTNTLNFVCMISTAVAPTTPADVEGVCMDGWVEFGGFCYFFSEHYDTLDWAGAAQHCANRAGLFSSGSLVSIHSVEEDAFVYKTLQSKGVLNAWIGLHEVDTGSPFSWSDGSAVQYLRWAPGEPNDFDGTQQCVELYVEMWPGMWNDHTCNSYFEYVCKAPKVAQITTPSSPPGLSCPPVDAGQPPWVPYGPYCYYFDPLNQMDFNRAQEFCVRLAGRHAHLATIHDSLTNALFVKMTEGSSSFATWIGLTRPNDDVEFRWIDQSELNYTNWLKGEPNNQYDEYCVEMRNSGGYWNDMPCSYSLPFTCQVHMEKFIAPTTTQSPGPDTSVPVSSGIWLSSGELAGIVLGTMFGTLLLVAIGVFIWYVVRGGELPLSKKSKKTDATDASSTYDLPYNNFEQSMSRSSSVRSASYRSECDA